VQCRRLPLPLPPLLNGPSLAIKLLAVFFPACSFSLIIRPPLFTLSAHVILAISLWDFVRRAFKIVISISTYIQLTIKNSLEQGFINKLQPRIHRGARNRKRKKRALQLLTLSDLHCCRIYIYIYIPLQLHVRVNNAHYKQSQAVLFPSPRLDLPRFFSPR